jgi:hypothetical protein
MYLLRLLGRKKERELSNKIAKTYSFLTPFFRLDIVTYTLNTLNRISVKYLIYGSRKALVDIPTRE